MRDSAAIILAGKLWHGQKDVAVVAAPEERYFSASLASGWLWEPSRGEKYGQGSLFFGSLLGGRTDLVMLEDYREG